MQHLNVEDLPKQVLIENYPFNVGFPGNRIGEITTGAYLVSIVEIVTGCQQVGNRTLLIANQCTLGLIWY